MLQKEFFSFLPPFSNWKLNLNKQCNRRGSRPLVKINYGYSAFGFLFFSNFINSPPRPIHVYQAPFSSSAFFNIKEIFFSLSNCPNHFRLVLSCWIAAAKIYLEGRIRSGTLPTNYYAIQWTFVSPCWEHSHALFFCFRFFFFFQTSNWERRNKKTYFS